MVAITDIRMSDAPAVMSAAKAAYTIRLARKETGAPQEVLTVEAPPAPEETEAPAPDKKKRGADFSVELIPGSMRVVTTVIDPETEAIRFRIPAFWTDVEAALEVTSKVTEL
jgi:hypothetical protein